jgi:hypothetical protein
VGTEGFSDWEDENNILTDGPLATSPGNSNIDTESPYLVGTNYGFTVPTGSSINGIKVTLYDIESPDGPNPDTAVLRVRVLKGGVIQGSDLGDNWTITFSPTTRDYGGASQLWGLTWTAEDINASTFGCALQVSNDRNDEVVIDSLLITVYYTEP